MKVLLLFPYYQAETDNISFLLISFQIVFATTYYTHSANSRQGLALEIYIQFSKLTFGKKSLYSYLGIIIVGSELWKTKQLRYTHAIN